jgi:hypothetical protein
MKQHTLGSRFMTRLPLLPRRAGQIAKAILVLQAHEIKGTMKEFIGSC